MKYYIIAGEASGDLHAANMMKYIKAYDPAAEFRCWGGDLMEQQGGYIIKHYKTLAFMGFVDVILNIRTILKNIKFCKSDIKAYQPDAVILVDYPGFNFRISDYVRNQLKIKTYYYISPTVWAWKPSRAKIVKKTVDKMFVILPFEKEFYKKQFDYEVEFVGHPLLDAINQYQPDTASIFDKYKLSNTQPIVLLMPGSRTREIKTMLPYMAQMVDEFDDCQFVISGVSTQELKLYKEYAGDRVLIIFDRAYDLLSVSSAALVTSGTATLEAALFKVPEVVCYKGDKLSWWVAKNFLVKNIKYISLVNLIMNKEVVRELLQEELTVSNLQKELKAILSGWKREKILKDYDQIQYELGGIGASKRVAQQIVEAMH